MRRNYAVITVVSLTLAAVLAQVSAQTLPNKTPAPKPGWEYRVLLNTDFVPNEKDADVAAQISAVEKKLNELGREGWEHSHQMRAAEIFKRPIR